MMFLRVLFLFLWSCHGFAQVDSELLSVETLRRFEKVPEFHFIIQEANKLGVKVYLFGGTASAFAHYVRWDLESEAGDNKYQRERFDYDFTNIYRGNQDLDIVVDGSYRDAQKLRDVLHKEYPHFVGDRDAWEVRLLRDGMGDKRPLLDDEDFKKQHSDTNSTGMLALNPDPGGIVYNDLLSWKNPESDFLKDVAAARIKFLYGAKHHETQRFKEGYNPPVLAAIRYLAKLAQYEVTEAEGDLEVVTKIIKETNFKKLSSYGKKKAEEFALKTLLNAPNSEYAWDLLDRTGARLKLIEMDGNQIQSSESLSWWMNKEPLRSSPLRSNTKGKTVFEIFDDTEIIVAHETNSFQAYENITRSARGEANAFISRDNVMGEAAAFGDGFYTRIGLEGARGSGLTIRFKLHPDAQEGIDFIKTGDYVIVQNKNALILIQENLDISLTDFFKLYINNSFGKNDKGLLTKFRRKFDRMMLTKTAKDKAFSEFDHQLYTGQGLPFLSQFDLSESLGASEENGKVSVLLEKYQKYIKDVVMPLFRDKEFWVNNGDVASAMLKRGMFEEELIMYVFSKGHDWISYEMIDYLIKKGGYEKNIIRNVLSQEKWALSTDWVDYFLSQNKVEIDDDIAQHVLTEEFATQRPEWIERILESYYENTKKENPIYMNHKTVARFLKEKHWRNSSFLRDFVDRKLQEEVKEQSILQKVKRSFNYKVISDDSPLIDIMAEDHWMGDPYQRNVIEKLFRSGPNGKRSNVVSRILSHRYWQEASDGFDLILKFYRVGKVTMNIDNDQIKYETFSRVFSNPIWLEDSRAISFIRKEIEKSETMILSYIVRGLFSKEHWLNSDKGMELFDLLLSKVSDGYKRNNVNYSRGFREIDVDVGGLYTDLARLFADDLFVKHPQSYRIMRALIISGLGQIRQSVLSALTSEEWKKHPRWIELIKWYIINFKDKKEVEELSEIINGDSNTFRHHPSITSDRGFRNFMTVEETRVYLIKQMRKRGDSAIYEKLSCSQSLY